MRRIDLDNFSRATRDTPRDINRRIILNLLRENGPQSRAQLSRRMEVPRGMITALVNDLLEAELVYEGTTADAPRGRRPTLIHLRSRDRLTVGVEIRADRTTVQVADFEGREIDRSSFETPDESAEFGKRVSERIEALLAVDTRRGECEGIGVVVPGMVHAPSGRILDAPTLGWRDMDLRSALEERFGLPVRVERDAVACALATVWHGDSSAGIDNFVYLVVSTGVGTGLVVHNQPVRGAHFSAGEFGHVQLDPSGPPCTCGGAGCLEAWASDPSTVSRYLGEPYLGRATHAAVRRSGVTIEDVVDRALAGETEAREALRTTAVHLGRGLAGIVKALDPGRVVLGGEIFRAWDFVEPILRDELEAQSLGHRFGDTRLDVDPDYRATYLKGASALVVAPTFAAPVIA